MLHSMLAAVVCSADLKMPESVAPLWASLADEARAFVQRL